MICAALVLALFLHLKYRAKKLFMPLVQTGTGPYGPSWGSLEVSLLGYRLALTCNPLISSDEHWCSKAVAKKMGSVMSELIFVVLQHSIEFEMVFE